MTPDQDCYYGRPEASNSDFSMLAKYWQSFQISYDIEAAFKFGTLVDCMITEPHRVDYFRFTCAGMQYTQEDFVKAQAMKDSFVKDDFCRLFLEKSEFQTTIVNPGFDFEWMGVKFKIATRCKPDCDARKKLGMIADVKSTNAKTQKEFETMVEAFSYDRQGAFYMDMGLTDRFVLLGISKIYPYPIFKVAIQRGDRRYLSGREKYSALAFKYHTLFSYFDLSLAA